MLSAVFLKKNIPVSWKRALHWLYAAYGALRYRFPSEKMYVIGITGTSGKSSTVFFLRKILEELGIKTGAVGTIEFNFGSDGRINDKKMTMPGRAEIQKFLRRMADSGCRAAIVETTSEGFVQFRHKFINYDLIALTNLYPEHIESHGGFENYKAAKLGIFEYVSSCARKLGTVFPEAAGDSGLIKKTCVINGNSEYANEFFNFTFEEKFFFGQADKKFFSEEDFVADRIKETSSGLEFTVNEQNFFAPLFGKHNAMNIMIAISVARKFGFDWDKIKKAVLKLSNPPGRMEIIQEASEFGFLTLVDYAFEPVALSALYDTVEVFNAKRVIHVCGSAGGGRDKSRRRPIGELVGSMADIVIVTNEDPYDEPPEEIMEEVAGGARRVGKEENQDLFIIPDRQIAINKAISLAEKGDLVLVTGKGSEQAICVEKGKKIPWDDRAAIKSALQNK